MMGHGGIEVRLTTRREDHHSRQQTYSPGNGSERRPVARSPPKRSPGYRGQAEAAATAALRFPDRKAWTTASARARAAALPGFVRCRRNAGSAGRFASHAQ